MAKIRLVSLSTGTPPDRFTQEDMTGLLGISDEKRLRFFRHPHVKTRHFLFSGGNLREESMSEQRQKFLKNAPSMSAGVLSRALDSANLKTSDLGCLVAVTSSGYFTPGLSVFISSQMNLPPDLHRLDVAGMGCHAGLNGLQAAGNWCLAHPGKLAALVCTELSSCIYNLDQSDNNALVNSLFGDGIAVVLLCADDKKQNGSLLGFSSYLIPHTEDHLRYEWLGDRNLFGFQVHKMTPETIGQSVKAPLTSFLSSHNVQFSQVKEWVVHGGGEAILSAIQNNLNLPAEALRHSRSVLRDFGNVASGSFLFSLEKLLAEKKLQSGDHVVFMAMGPGLSLELALLKWS